MGFIGQYVEDFKKCLIASAVSHDHMVAIGEPGTGKTEIELAAAEIMFGEDRYGFFEIESSTQPDEIKGLPDPVEALQHGRLKIIREGTAYDPNYVAIIADEWGRGMDAVFDTFIHIMGKKSKEPDKTPLVWGTANFMPESTRAAAMIDRIPLWFWIPDEPIDVYAFVCAQMENIGRRMTFDTDGFPSLSDIQRIQAARPGEHAKQAVATTIERLANEARNGVRNSEGKLIAAFKPNRRRYAQWQKILYRCGVLYSGGDDDFSIVPAEASYVLQWAYPTKSATEAAHWRQIASSVVDPIGTAIAGMMENSYKKLMDIQKRQTNPTSRAQELGKAIITENEKMRQLKAQFPEAADRVDTALNELQEVFAKIVLGQDPMKEG